MPTDRRSLRARRAARAEHPHTLPASVARGSVARGSVARGSVARGSIAQGGSVARGASVALAAVVVLAAVLAAPRAEGAARLSVVVEAPPSLARRLANQLSDLPAAITFTPPRVPAAEDDVLSRARTVAADGDPDVAVIVEPVPGAAAYALHVADLRAERVSSRVLGRGLDGGSALDEAVALAVRSALQALTLGGELPAPDAELDAARPTRGRSDRAGATDERADAEDARGATDARADGSIADPTGAPRGGVHVRGAIGGLAGFGGGSSPWFGAASLHAGLFVHPRVEVGVDGMFGASRALSDALTTIDVTRHGVLSSAALTLYHGTGVRLDSALLAGVVVHHQATRALAAGVVVEAPSTKLSFAAGLELRGRVVVVEPFAIELVLGADVVPGAPIYEYRRGAERTARDVLAIVQPRAGLGLSFEAR